MNDRPCNEGVAAANRIDLLVGVPCIRCRALRVDFPQTGLVPVRCQLILNELPAPYVGGLLTTNTITSRAAFGGDTDPPGYTQASIATIRLWKSK